MDKYRVIFEEGWYKVQKYHWFYGWEFVTLGRTMDGVIEELRLKLKVYAIEIDSYSLKIHE